MLRRNLFAVQQWNVVNIHTGNCINNKKNFYDVLEITPKATKGDIKKSYYRLSLLYHPDQNKDDEKAANKFREITEAYEVLGDVTKRRMYDKGLFGFGASGTATTDAGVYSKYYNPSKKAPSVGRTNIYDFDAWSKFHYQDNFERQQRERKEKIYYQNMMKKNKEMKEQGSNTSFYSLLFFIVGLGYLFMYFEEDKDRKR